MVVLSQKLGFSHKPPKDHLDHASSLATFRSKIADFIAQTFLNHPKSDDGRRALLSLAGFQKCFQLIHFTNTAFAQLVADVDHPMTRWGPTSTEEYLSYSVNLLDILNAITSSLSHLNQARVSILHSVISTSHRAPGNYNLQEKVSVSIGKDFKLEDSMSRVRLMDGNEIIDTEKESVVVQALRVSKKVRKLWLQDRIKDSITERLDLRLYKEVVGEAMIAMEDVREICSSSVEEIRERLKVMENAIKGVEKAANDMFYDVLGRRNKLLDNFRLTGKKIK